MKKIFLLLLIFISIKVFGQFTQPQNFGSKTTLVQNKGGFVSDSALILPHFTDTTRANLGPAPDFYAGNIIRTVDTPWMRSNDATRWISLFPKNTTITADNGLTMSTPINVQLGGTLLHTTTIDGTASEYKLNFTGVNNTFFNAPFNFENTSSSPGTSALTAVGVNAIFANGTGIGVYSVGSTGVYAYGSSIGINAVGTSTNAYGVLASVGDGTGIQAISTAGYSGDFFRSNNTTTGIESVVKISRQSGGSSASNGYGASVDYSFITSNGSSQQIANKLVSTWSDATEATRTSQFIISGVDTAVTKNVLVINGDGSIKFPQYVGGDFTGTPLYGLAVDASGNVILDSVSSGGGGISGITADNGLTANTSTNVQLGGNSAPGRILLHDTYINADAFILKINSTTAGINTFQVQSSGSNAIAITGTGGAYGGRFTGTSTAGVAGFSDGTFGAVYGQTETGTAGIFRAISSSTNTSYNVLEVQNRAFTSPSAGIGAQIGFSIGTTSIGTFATSNQLISTFTDPTNGSQVSQFLITGVDNAVTQDLLTLSGSGAAKLNQYGSGTFSGTAAFTLAVDASGNVIEVTGGGGGISSLTSVGGGLDIQSGGAGNINTLAAADFDLASNLITIDATKWLTISAGNAAYQPLDADLTTIAGLTATTDNFIVSVSSAWASRTPAQVRTTLGLVIGTDVQAWDADLDTWAGITPGSNVGTFLGTPSSANLRAALTDENGTGVLLFNAATTPSFTTGIQIGGAAASRKILVGDGTNFIPSTETWATPSTTGNVLTSDGTNWVSSPTVKYAAATAGTTTSNSLTDLTGMSIALTAGTWVFDIWIYGQAGTGTAGAQFGVNYTGTTTSIEANCAGQVSTTGFAATTRITAINTASVVVFTTSAAEGWVHISGKIVVSDAGDLRARGLKVTSQTLTWRASSWMKAYKVA